MPSGKLSTRIKICYALGDAANGLALSTCAFWMMQYLTDVMYLAPALAGLALTLGRTWNALVDPVMGWLADTTRSRFGSRRPYLLFGAPFYALFFIVLWSLPRVESDILLCLLTTLAFVFFNTAFSLVFIPYTSLTAVMTDDYHERTSLTGFRMVVSQLAFFVGSILPPLAVALFAKQGTREALGTILPASLVPLLQTARPGYIAMAMFCAVVMVLSIWTTFLFGSSEKVGDSEPKSATSPFDYFKGIAELLRHNDAFRFAIGIVASANIAVAFVATNLPYFLEHGLGIGKKGQGAVIGVMFGAGILALPLWIRWSKKYGKAATFWRAMLGMALLVSILSFVPRSLAWAVYPLAIGAGACYSAALMLPWAMLPDVVEYDQVSTGLRREGLIFGGTTFCYKLLSGVALFFSGQILTFSGYTPGQTQTSGALFGIRALVGALPLIFLLISIYFARKYPLSETAFNELKSSLSEN
jgi:glycoside/pentoside/hexuronide:cation symporter, GPH family